MTPRCDSLASTSPQFYDYYQNADGQSMQLFFQNGFLSQKVETGSALAGPGERADSAQGGGHEMRVRRSGERRLRFV